MGSRLSERSLIVLMCAMLMLTVLSLAVYAAQLTQLKTLWSLSNTEAGWIGAAYFIGYTLSVPILSSLTDRVDPKRIYLTGAGLLGAGCIGFGFFAEGFESALLLHAFAGAGLAGTYMPGLKALTDHVSDKNQSRASSFYTASFGAGAAASYLFSGYIGQWLGWSAAFIGAGIASLIAGLLCWAYLPKADLSKLNVASTRLLDFRPVLRNRAAMAYTLTYAVHCWELFGLRTWVVAFLLYADKLHGASPTILIPSVIAALLTVLGAPSTILGNELAMRFGRRRMISLMMCLSALLCFTIGLTAQISYWLAAFFCIAHGITVIMDSAAITAGAIRSAEPGYRGATMAVHATLGFSGATLGPLIFGWALDVGGGQVPLGWWLGFAHMGVILLLGPLMLWLMRPPPISGDGL